MTKPPKDIGASVRVRLLRLARAREEDFQLVLTRYANEQPLYRLCSSRHARLRVDVGFGGAIKAAHGLDSANCGRALKSASTEPTQTHSAHGGEILDQTRKPVASRSILVYCQAMSDDTPKSALLEASVLLLAAAGGELPITSLNKALFYLDLCALRDFGRQATGAEYLALRAGPVVASYERRVIKALERAGIAQQDEDESGAKPMCLIAEYTPHILDTELINSAQRIGKWAKAKSPKELSDFSHKNVAWQLAWQAGLAEGGTGYAAPLNLRLAMQQVLDADPWVKEPADDEVAALVSGALDWECAPL